MSRPFKVATGTVLLITAAVWTLGIARNTFLAREIGFYAVLFLVPAGALCSSVWLAFQGPLWRRIVGWVAIVPTFAVWALSLLLVYGGFKIH